MNEVLDHIKNYIRTTYPTTWYGTVCTIEQSYVPYIRVKISDSLRVKLISSLTNASLLHQFKRKLEKVVKNDLNCYVAIIVE